MSDEYEIHEAQLALQSLVLDLFVLLKDKGWQITTAESCTGGWLAQSLTAVPGISEVFQTGWVTYSCQAKTKQLGVGEGLLEAHGPYSHACVEAMAQGALAKSDANIAVAISGVAGPSGDAPENPVGAVYICVLADNASPKTVFKQLSGHRQQIRYLAIELALQTVIHSLRNETV